MSEITINFAVKITYEHLDGGQVCKEKMEQILHKALDECRANGGLSDAETAASNLTIEQIA